MFISFLCDTEIVRMYSYQGEPAFLSPVGKSYRIGSPDVFSCVNPV